MNDNIKHILIEHRLIHGNTALNWIDSFQCKRIMVIDDETANNELFKSMYRATVHRTIAISVLTTEQAIKNLKTPNHYGDVSIAVIAKDTKPIVALMENGIDFECDIDITTLTPCKERNIVLSGLCKVNEDDLKDLRYFINHGKKIYHKQSLEQIVPDLEGKIYEL